MPKVFSFRCFSRPNKAKRPSSLACFLVLSPRCLIHNLLNMNPAHSHPHAQPTQVRLISCWRTRSDFPIYFPVGWLPFPRRMKFESDFTARELSCPADHPLAFAHTLGQIFRCRGSDDVNYCPESIYACTSGYMEVNK